MDTPQYTSDIIIGGADQTTFFSGAFPAPTSSQNDGIITRQSGELVLTCYQSDGVTPFDLTSLDSLDAKIVPWNTQVVPIVLGAGVISGAGNNVYTVSWTADTIPSSWSSYASDREGAIVLFVAFEETAAEDFFQTYTRFNVNDGNFAGDGQTTPSIEFSYEWNDANSSDWTKYGQGTPTNLGDAVTTLAQAGKTDWGIVINQTEVTAPVSPTNGDTYVIAGIGGDWSGFTIDDIARWNGTIWTNKTPVDGDEIFNAALSARYRYDGAAWAIASSGGDVTGPAVAVDDNLCTFDSTTGKLIQDSGVNISAVNDNTAKVTNAMHTGDVTGDSALTIESVAITGQTTVTAASGDFIMISDTSDSGDLKKVDALDFLSGGGGGAGIAANWTFSTDTTATDPTAGGIKYNNATPASVTAIYVNTAANNTANFEALISALGSGDTLYLQQLDDDADFIVFNVTSSVDNTGWYTINGTIADSGTLPANASDVGVNFSYTSGGAGASVTSVFGRTGAVMAAASDYDASQVDNDSGVVGAFVSNALDTLDTASDPATIAAGTDNNQTGTTYTLVLTDADNKTVWMNNASANTLTVPTNASVAFPVGTKINVMMEGAGTTTIDGDTGVTVNGVSGGAVAINTQNQGATLTKRATDTWIVTGDIGTSGEAFNGFKENLIIDGQFNHWDAGAGPFTINNAYTATMWSLILGGGSPSVSRFTFTEGQTDVPYNPKYGISLAGVSGSPYINTKLGKLHETSGLTVNISAYLKADVSMSGTNFQIQQNFGSGGSSSVNTNSAAFTVGTSWTKYEGVITIPSISSKTIGGNSFIRLAILSSDISLGTLEISNIAMVYGSVAYDQPFPTPAEERHRIDEYYQIIGDYDEGVAGADLLQMYPTQAGTPATVRESTIPLRRKMRAVPTVTLGTPSAGTLDSSTATTTAVIVTGTASGISADQKFDYIELDARL
jgi:hypothetical protein